MRKNILKKVFMTAYTAPMSPTDPQRGGKKEKKKDEKTKTRSSSELHESPCVNRLQTVRTNLSCAKSSMAWGSQAHFHLFSHQEMLLLQLPTEQQCPTHGAELHAPGLFASGPLTRPHKHPISTLEAQGGAQSWDFFPQQQTQQWLFP